MLKKKDSCCNGSLKTLIPACAGGSKAGGISNKTMICMIMCIIFFVLLFQGSTIAVSTTEILVPSFGMGRINIRLYTDYFCGPCRTMEPKVEPILTELVKKNNINLTFIDTPLHKDSMLYARYFLYTMNEKKDFDFALLARSVLIGASLEKITDQAKLEEYLRGKGIKFKPFEVKPTLNILNNNLKEDKIQSTPTCIIEQDGKIERYSGGQDIIKALERIKQDALIKNTTK